MNDANVHHFPFPGFRVTLERDVFINNKREVLLIDDLDNFWFEILSKDPDRIDKAWQWLDDDEQHALINHLQRMSSETGWQEGQRRRAQMALAVIAKRARTQHLHSPDDE